MDEPIPVDGALLPATLTLPEGPAKAGVVVLHGAEAGERSYFLYEHLAEALRGQGFAVLCYDRRPAPDGGDVPLRVQAADALVALGRLRRRLDGAPVGLWGFSQGAWAATETAAADPGAVACLVLVSWCGVSPAAQMRAGCATQLRTHGFDENAVADLTETRLAMEECLRGGGDRQAAQSLLARAVSQPWFDLAYLPETVPEPGAWDDMDFDPARALARLTCPVLAFYGETDQWMPIEESVAVWRAAADEGVLADVTVVRLAGADHLPTEGGRPDRTAVSDHYTGTLVAWMSEVASGRRGH